MSFALGRIKSVAVLRVIVVGLVASLAGCSAHTGFPPGPMFTARLLRPDLFTPECVARAGDVYVVCGNAERMFPDEPDADLLDEARLDAESRLAEQLGATSLDLAAFTPAHDWTTCGGRVVVANFTVPVSSVTVTARRPPPPSRSSSSPRFQCPDAF